MSAVPNLRLVCPPDAAPCDDGQTWYWLPDAAAKMGVTPDSLRNRCLSTLQHKGLARKADRGGVMVWQISELADPRLAVVQSPEAKSARADALLGLTDAQRDEVLRRERIVKDLEGFVRDSFKLGLGRKEAIERYAAQLAASGRGVSERTLYRWLAAWEQDGIKGLIDQRWRSVKPDAEQDEKLYRSTLLALWLDPRKRSLKLCHEMASHHVEQMGLTAPSYTTAKRTVASIPPAVVTAKREGRKAFEDNHAPYIARDYSSIASNDWWCSDHYRMDVAVRIGDRLNRKTGEVEPVYGRPWLHAWMDVRSRKIVGWALVPHDPNADLILRVVAQAIRQHGVPRHVYIDNGWDYDARQLQSVTKAERRAGIKPGDLTPADLRRLGGAFGLLGIEVVHCWPYHGQAKPNEAWHRKIKERFCKQFDTFTGGSAAEKPEDLERQLRGGKARRGRPATLSHAPTLEELSAAFADWIRDDHNGRPHMGDSMDGQTPEQVHAACLERKATLPDHLIKFACMPRIGPVTIRQNGVHWSDMSFNSPELDARYGERVMLAIDVEDTSSVIVLDLDGRPICRATANAKLPWGTGRQELREAVVAKRKAIKAMAAYHEARPRLALDIPELARAMAADKAEAARKAAAPVEPPPAAIVQTPLNDHLDAIARVFQGPRRAVGAESMADQTPVETGIPSGFIYVRKEDDDE